MNIDNFQDDVFEEDIIFMHFSHNCYNLNTSRDK